MRIKHIAWLAVCRCHRPVRRETLNAFAHSPGLECAAVRARNMEPASPRTQRDAAAARETMQRRANLVQQFFEALVAMRYRGDRGTFASNLAAVHYSFVTVEDVRVVLESMMEMELAKEDGCTTAFALLDEGLFELAPQHFVELHQIACDTLQYRLHGGLQIQSTLPEGVPEPQSQQSSAADAARTCWVGGLPDGTTVEQVVELMGQFGKVDSGSMRDKSQGAGTHLNSGSSYAFVKFEDASSAVAATRHVLTTPLLLGACELKVEKVDHEMLQARRGRKASIGASNAVWEASRG